MQRALLRGVGVAVLLSLVAFGTGCAPKENAEGPVFLDARVDTALVIGVNEEKGPAYALGDPVGVAVDSVGRVYVADAQIPAVQVYDDTGTHLRTIGRKGPGPGESQDLRDLHVHGDTLTVICPTEVEQFRLDGRPLDTYALGDRASRHTLRRPDGRWIVGAYVPGERNALFRVHTEAFGRTAQAFGSPEPFVDENFVSRFVLQSKFGSLGRIEKGAVVFAPYLYGGEIVEYLRRDETWKRADTWTGYAERGAYDYEKVSSDAPSTMEQQIHTIEGGERTVFNAVYYNKSLGLFRRGGRVFHFTSIARGEYRLFGAEVYAPNGEMQGYVPLKEVATDEDGVPTEVTPTPEAVGPNGAIYLIERGFDTVPRVLVLSLTVGERG